MLQRLRNNRARKRRESGRTRHAAQTVSERQATSQWKSTRERGAETPEEKETRNGSSAIRHFERGDEDVTQDCHTTLASTPDWLLFYHIFNTYDPVKQQRRNKPVPNCITKPGKLNTE